MYRMHKKGKYQKLTNSSADYSSDDDNQWEENDKIRLIKEVPVSSEGIKLKQNVGVADGIGIVVGSMIGSGIFIVPTGVLQHCNGDMSLSMLIWIIGGIIAILIALCFCELATLIPESGGMGPFIKTIYGDGTCFVFLWLFLFTASPQGSAVQIIALGDYISQAVAVGLGLCVEDLPPTLSKLIGFSITLLLLACNATSVKMAVKIQLWCTIGKVAALIIISVAGLAVIVGDSTTLINNLHYSHIINSHVVVNVSQSSMKEALIASVNAAPGLPGLSLAVFQALWAYDGFDSITCLTEEVKNPKKTLPMIIILSLLTVVALYLIVNLSYFAVLTQKEMLNSDAVAVSFAAKVHPLLAYVVTFGVCLSLIGSINISFLTAGRMPFVAARMGFMPEILSMVHIEYYSPLPALLFLTSLTAVMILPSDITSLLGAVVFTMWAFRALCVIGIFVLRRTMKDSYRPYKVYKVTALLAIAVNVYVVIVPLAFKPQSLYILTLVLIVVFTFLYWAVKKRFLFMAGIGKGTIFLQKLFQVSPTTSAKVE